MGVGGGVWNGGMEWVGGMEWGGGGMEWVGGMEWGVWNGVDRSDKTKAVNDQNP